jgi:4-hydroxybenzoate polyprenyltransferase
MNSNPQPPKKLRKELVLAACGRPNLLLPAWLSAATGAALSGGSLPSVVPLVVITAGFSLALGASHAANLIADRHSDKINDKNTFWMGQIPATIVARHAAGWAIMGLMLSAWAHWYFLFPVVATLVLGFSYSLPPARLSARWGWDLLANVLGYGVIAPWWGAMLSHWEPSVSAPVLDIPWMALAFLVPLVGLVFFWTTILDVKGDRSSGKNTLAVRLNFSGTSHRKLLIMGIFTGTLAAGIPGLLAFPLLGIWIVFWFILSYGLTRHIAKSSVPR